jgi:hypothetical protein
MYKVLLFVGVKDNGDNPTAITDPLDVPLLTVIQSVATVVIAIYGVPTTAPLQTEYSPAN